MKTEQTQDGFCRRIKSIRATSKGLRNLWVICLGLITFVVWANPAVGQTFTPTGSMTTRHIWPRATLLNSGKVLITGGQNESGVTDSSELYDPATGTFTPTGSMASPRLEHTATLLQNGKVLIAGGYGKFNDDDGAPVAVDTAELYDPSTETFTATGSMSIVRGDHTATLLQNGMVLIVGGQNGNGYVWYSSAELYNPATGTFTATDSMSIVHGEHTATLLQNGKVLIAQSIAEDTSQLYDPATGIFTPTGSMSAPREYHTATLLNNGMVLIVGGKNGPTYAQLYDPATGIFTITGSMTGPRWFHTATLLNNGTVLIAGGHDGVNMLDSAELYDPATGTFTVTGSMTSPRGGHSATLLNNGEVLIAGGPNEYGASAELYTPPTEIPPSEQIAAIIDFFDAAIQAGTLDGTGAHTILKKVNRDLFRSILVAAKTSIDGDHKKLACFFVNSAYQSSDGMRKPPDLVVGYDCAELNDMLGELKADLECN